MIVNYFIPGAEDRDYSSVGTLSVSIIGIWIGVRFKKKYDDVYFVTMRHIALVAIIPWILESLFKIPFIIDNELGGIENLIVLLIGLPLLYGTIFGYLYGGAVVGGWCYSKLNLLTRNSNRPPKSGGG